MRLALVSGLALLLGCSGSAPPPRTAAASAAPATTPTSVAPDPRHLRALPDDGEAQVLRVEGERRGQAVAGRNHRSHRAERRFHRNLPEGGVRRERLQEKRAVRGERSAGRLPYPELEGS